MTNFQIEQLMISNKQITLYIDNVPINTLNKIYYKLGFIDFDSPNKYIESQYNYLYKII